MSFWDPENLRRVLGGEWLAPPAPGVHPRGVSIDTRTLAPGQVFIAIAGDRTDGHAYLRQAARAGAALAVVERGPDAPGSPDAATARATPLPRLRVASTREALLRLGAAYRRALGPTRVIAVGGSNGKTTTVRLIESVLSRTLRGTASARSFNNAIGVPLTILGAREGDDFLIGEVGTNAPGEIAQLAAVVEPDIAVITSIGREHLEGLGSLDGVCREEASLAGFVRPGGAIVANADAPGLIERVREQLETRPNGPRSEQDAPGPRLVTFGTAPHADVRVDWTRQAPDGLRFHVAGRGEFGLPLLGRHNAINAAAAIAVGGLMGLDDEAIRAGLAAAPGAPMRLERLRLGEIEILNDAYNANPDSMRAAIQTLADVGAGAARRVAILGDMLELGAHAVEAHREIGRLLRGSAAADLAVLVGPLMRHAADERPGPATIHLPGLDGAHVARVLDLLRPGDLVLLKGSRRMGLERLADALRERHAAPAPPPAEARPR